MVTIMSNIMPSNKSCDDTNESQSSEQKFTTDDNQTDQPHGIFDERIQSLMDEFGRSCERDGIHTAVAIVVDPKSDSAPYVFTRGNIYDIGLVITSLLRQIRANINKSMMP